jgi:glycosyltransferase involved in cell wall biosynthesis
MTGSIDILMITYNRPSYTKIALERLLDTCTTDMRVWVWHNGSDQATLDIVRGFSSHPSFYKFHHSEINQKLTVPTNWCWGQASGDYITKVDDDCLMPFGWADTLRAAHELNPKFGVIGCWRFPDADFVPELAKKKIHEFNGGHSLMRNCWVEGSGYLMKRECVEKLGPLKAGQSFPNYCIELAKLGYINGWYYPFLYQNHFDDPRSEYSQLRSDADIEKWAPLSAIKNGVKTVDDWQNQLQRSAFLLQRAPYDPKHYSGWRARLAKVRGRLYKLMGKKADW